MVLHARLHGRTASKQAIARVEELGGSVTTVYYNRLGLRVMLKPHKFDPKRVPRFAQPTSVRDRIYYSSEENRGYLAKAVAAGQPAPGFLTPSAATLAASSSSSSSPPPTSGAAAGKAAVASPSRS